jgi:hypothetical protein
MSPARALSSRLARLTWKGRLNSLMLSCLMCCSIRTLPSKISCSMSAASPVPHGLSPAA